MRARILSFVGLSFVVACNRHGDQPATDGGNRFEASDSVTDRVAGDVVHDAATDPADATSDASEADTSSDRVATDGVPDVADAGVDAQQDAPSGFNCIGRWPQGAPVSKQPSIATQPRVLWSIQLPSSRIQPVLAVTGTGVAFAAEKTLTIVDGAGGVVSQVTKTGMTGYLSSPIADADGDLYFADSVAAYRVDGMGREVWKASLGPYRGTSEVSAPWTPIMDSDGRVYLSGLDNNLWVLRASDGQSIASYPLGSSRSLAMGVADVLFMDRTGMSVTGSPSLGVFVPATGEWVGEIASFGGSVPGAIAGFDIGIVAYGWVDTNAETSASIIFDRCGNRRWQVPGSYSWPLAISFGDDLIVRDKTPVGGGSYTYSIRRFSRDGVLVAGPYNSPALCPGAVGQVGADDTLYLLTSDASGTSVVALDASLNQLWSVPVGNNVGCTRYVLNSDGKLFVAGARLVAIQTTSPGPAPVSWARSVARDSRGSSWLAQ